jgi:hypothetical protein
MKARHLLAAALALVSSAQVFAEGGGGPVEVPDSASVVGLLVLGAVAVFAFRRKSK